MKAEGMATDLEVAREAILRPIAEIAARAGVPESALEPYGKHKAKVSLDFVAEQRAKPAGKLVLVTGISPTAAGEGKTTTTSPEISTPSPAPTTCWRRCSTTICTGATRSGSTRAVWRGGGRWT